MASIKVKFRPSAVADHEGAIYYQIIAGRKVRQLLTVFRVMPDEWDESLATVKTGDAGSRGEWLLSVSREIRRDIERFRRIERRMAAERPDYTVDDLVRAFRRHTAENTLFRYMERIIRRLRSNGHVRTSETYRSTMNRFRRFRQGHDILLDALTHEETEAYESWLRGKGLTPNTTSFYARILRAVYNRAVEEDITEDRSPFRRVYTGVARTGKRAIPLKSLRKIKNLDLRHLPELDYARDMFMISFMLRGMSFIDMAYLRKSDLCGGRLTYRRRKTGQRLAIAWTAEMAAILAKYPPNGSSYLLPVIRRNDINGRNSYRRIGAKINRSLKEIAKMAGIDMPLTMYVARHSWASAAYAKRVPIGVISEGMGHDSEATTRIYLASLETSAVDSANAMIISSL